MSFLQTTDKQRKRPLTEKQEKFLSALAGEANGDARKALTVAGYEQTSYYAVLDSLKEEVVDVANSILAHSAPKAAAKLVDVLESDAPIPQVGAKLQAAQTLLDRVGISKKERVDVNHNVTGGIFLLPDKEDIKSRKLPNQTTGLVITSIQNNSPLAGSIEVNSIIVEAQKERIKTIDDLKKITKQVLNSNQKTILLAIYNNQNQRRYIGIKLD